MFAVSCFTQVCDSGFDLNVQFQCLFPHSLLEWLNPKALRWEEITKEEAPAVGTESLEGEKVIEAQPKPSRAT